MNSPTGGGPDAASSTHSGLVQRINGQAGSHPVATVIGDLVAFAAVGYVIGAIGYGGGSVTWGVILGCCLGVIGLLVGRRAVAAARGSSHDQS